MRFVTTPVRQVRPFLALATLIVWHTMLGPPVAKAQSKVEIVPDVSHSFSIQVIAFSPEGQRFLTGSADNTIKLWDMPTGLLLRTFAGHRSWINALAFSPDGKRIVSGSGGEPGSRDNSVRLWDALTGDLIRTYEGHTGGGFLSSGVNTVAFSPDGSQILSGGRDGKAKLWDASSGSLLREFDVRGRRDPNDASGSYVHAAFSPDGNRVFTGSTEGKLQTWDTRTGELLKTYEDEMSMVLALAISSDGQMIATASYDKRIRIWEAATGTVRFRSGIGIKPATSVAFSAGGQQLIIGGGEGSVTLLDAHAGQEVLTFRASESGYLSVAPSPDGKQLVSGDSNFLVQFWDISSGKPLRRIDPNVGWITTLAISPDGGRLLSGGGDRVPKLWDPTSGRLLRVFEGHSDWISAVDFSPDGRNVLSASGDKTVRLWDAQSGRLIRLFAGHQTAVRAIAVTPDGNRLVSASGEVVRMWDMATGRLVRTMNGHSGTVASVAISRDGLRIASASIGKPDEVEGHEDYTIKLWDANTGRLLNTLQGHRGGVAAVTFSPDGNLVASGSLDATLRIWDPSTGKLLRTLNGHGGSVVSTAFSPDGRQLLSASWDKTAKLWDVASGKLLRSFEGHSFRVNAVVFARDGRQVVTGAGDSTLRFWQADAPAGESPTREWLVNLVSSREGEWLAITPSGFFAGSPGGASLLSIVRGFTLTGIDQVHQSLFSPDLVREALAGDPAGEVSASGQVINLGKVLDSGPPPSVAITSHPAHAEVANDLVTMQTIVTDNGKGVGRIEWRVNGVTVAVLGKPSDAGPVHVVTRTLALDPGLNTIEVVAYNAANLLASTPARRTIKFTGSANSIKPKLHILAIGINAYVDKGYAPPGSDIREAFPPLGLAVKDATVLADQLARAAETLYSDVLVTKALDQDATRDHLQRLVDEIADRIEPRDTFILFAAAHGIAQNGRFYLIPQDYDGGPDPRALAERAIGQELLQDWLANHIKAKKAVLLLDTCESGALVAGHTRSRLDGAASEAGIGRLHEATGRPVLTAAASGQFAHEGVIAQTGQRHGVFTWALLDALRNGDTNADGLIELSELVDHVQRIVPAIAAKFGGEGRSATAVPEPVFGKQSARFGSHGEDFVIAKRLEADIAPNR